MNGRTIIRRSKQAFVTQQIYLLPMKRELFISTGSNEGDRADNLNAVVPHLEKSLGTLVDSSAIYECPAWGFDGHAFLNQILVFQADISAKSVIDLLLDIERSMGRVRKEQDGYSNRLIDLDLIFHGDTVIDEKGVQVPHPRMHLRNFVLIPMLDVAPMFQHPTMHKTMLELLEECPDESDLTAWK